MLDFSNLHKEKNLSRNGQDRLFSFTVISNNNWYKVYYALLINYQSQEFFINSSSTLFKKAFVVF